ncbi:alcohol dehydrogenase catalytic domain-containing protein [Sinorhizobium meliloti]|uniref:alcohol dehydrogenase catalytic domain-containing protein n=1 Tax=Rhizobium meliloti TaxID=382 RepID=UPI001F1EF935|nr:alcohol dehydrogenase catalytic domain-containing protein [Sinorhizobium meliloti]
MKAWVHHETGTPDVLGLVDRPQPRPARGEVLVRNRAVGLNPVDWKFISWGHAAWKWPHIPGVDGAGEIVELGEGIAHLRLPASLITMTYHGPAPLPNTLSSRRVQPFRCPTRCPSRRPRLFPARG